MITRPFNFESHVRPPPSGPDVVSFVNVCALLLFFGMLGSRFVLAPGMALKLRLPATVGAAHDALPTSRVLTVSEVEGREMLIFEGRIHTLASFARALGEHPGGFAGEVLLLRMDRDVSMELLVRVTEQATKAGFADVMLAAEPEPAVTTGGGG
jgi:biopolymer transport protein ExbD